MACQNVIERHFSICLVSCLDQILIMLIGLSSVLCLLLAWNNIPTFSLDIIKPSLAQTFPSVYEARWISRGIQSLALSALSCRSDSRHVDRKHFSIVIENITLSLRSDSRHIDIKHFSIVIETQFYELRFQIAFLYVVRFHRYTPV
jgi:hypothetical protein